MGLKIVTKKVDKKNPSIVQGETDVFFSISRM
jgi:hypothetical protein